MSKEQKSSFDELLAELNAGTAQQGDLTKSIAEGGDEDDKDDKNIKNAADDGKQGDDEGADNPEDKDDEPVLTKSIKVGEEEFDVVDADQLVKSLNDLGGRVTVTEGHLLKALSGMIEGQKAQTALIKSMQDQIKKLSGQPAGRKTVLTVHEKPLAKAQPGSDAGGDEEGMTAGEFLIKSHAAFDAKSITGKELTTIDVAARTNQLGTLDAGLVTKVLNAK